MKVFTLALALALSPPFAQLAPGDTIFRGGPADGMSRGPVVSREGEFSLVALIPSAPNASPPAEGDRSVLEDLLRAYDNGSELPQSAIAVGATEFFCPADVGPQCVNRSFQAFPIGTGYSYNTPYRLQDGRVRIEWLRDGNLRYLTFLTIQDGKVVRAETLPSVIPMREPTAAPGNSNNG